MSSVNELESLVNSLAVALMTSDLSDAKETEQVKSLLQEIVSKSKSDPEFTKIYESAEPLLAKLLEGYHPALLNDLSSFSQNVQEYLLNPGSSFESGKKSAQAEIAEDVDVELLKELIEKHIGGLEDLEGLLMERVGGDPQGWKEPSFVSSVKGYIHTLKGDAGSLGVYGIERACHFVEDYIGSNTLDALLEGILALKEWCTGWLVALRDGEAPSPSWEVFKGRFIELVEGEKKATPPTEASSQSDNDFPDANLDLLAELLGDGAQVVQEEETAVDESSYKITGDREIFVEFAVEAEDHLTAIEETILEAQGNFNKESVDTIFRGIHSIKGASSYFKLIEIAETSHVTESLLDQVRDGKRVFDQGLIELVLSYVDLQRTLLAAAKAAIADSGIIKKVPQSSNYMTQLKAYEKSGVADAPEPREVSTPQDSNEREPAAAKGEKLEVKNFVKVDTDRLDSLMDSIGEMSIYSSMLIQLCRENMPDNPAIIDVTHQVEKFSKDLQQIGMSMRLVPIRGLFQKMSRLVWDVAKKVGKEIKFGMEGEDTELDRTIFEKLADPLMHMIRNAIDHGVETPEDRVKAGKSREGRIELAAFHAGGNIHIQIRDDGRGLNPEKLIKKAIEKGIVQEGQKLSDQEAFQLIFAAGFSTAAQVTDLSGRGVGMDVVRRNIESMRGRVHIESSIGRGTTFTIELPLTLAIIDGIQVRVKSDTFIIPTLSVIEFMKPTKDMITRALDRGETFHFRGQYIPIYRLGSLFEIEPEKSEPEDAIFVVVETGLQRFALMVDEITNTYSTVIKGVGEMFEQNKGVAGCAIRPNGEVALILDLRSLLELARSEYAEFKTRSEVEGSLGMNIH